MKPTRNSRFEWRRNLASTDNCANLSSPRGCFSIRSIFPAHQPKTKQPLTTHNVPFPLTTVHNFTSPFNVQHHPRHTVTACHCSKKAASTHTDRPVAHPVFVLPAIHVPSDAIPKHGRTFGSAIPNNPSTESVQYQNTTVPLVLQYLKIHVP